MYQHIIKRAIDFLFALILSVPAVVIVCICYIAIKSTTKGPAFFVQERPGYKGKIFRIYKLRTMRVETVENGRLLMDSERITKVGKLIRACSFDELPQLLNVIKGEMSFIGPRPLMVQYLPLYTAEQMKRHDVLPGISGWAQVNGRNQITWQKKFEYDIYYVEHISFLLDAKILYLTIMNVIKHQGINSGIDETMPDFDGTN